MASKLRNRCVWRHAQVVYTVDSKLIYAQYVYGKLKIAM